jgi:cell division septal protein FtsQ
MRRKKSQLQPMVRPRRRPSASRRFSVPRLSFRWPRLSIAAWTPRRPLSPRLRRFGLVVAVVLLSTAAIGVAADAAYEPLAQELRDAQWLRLRAIEVSGCRSVAEATVRACAAELIGRNIFEVDPQAVASRIKEIPRVREARVWRRYLSGSLRVEVVERLPIALLVAADGSLDEVDADGVRTPVDADQPPHDLPFLAAGATADSAALRSACELLVALQEKGLGVLMSEISLRDPEHPRGIAVESGTVIRFSSHYPATIQAEHLAVVLQALGDDGIVAESIDLRFPGRAEVMPRRSDAEASPGLSKRG